MGECVNFDFFVKNVKVSKLNMHNICVILLKSKVVAFEKDI